MGSKQPIPRVGGPKSCTQKTGSLFEREAARQPTSADRERQQFLMDYYRKKFIDVEAAEAEAEAAASSSVTEADHGFGPAFGFASMSLASSPSPEWGQDDLDENRVVAGEEVHFASIKESMRLPVVATAFAHAVPAAVGPPPMPIDSEAGETQRRPWRQQDVVPDEAARTQRQFYSPRVAREASLPPVSPRVWESSLPPMAAAAASNQNLSSARPQPATGSSSRAMPAAFAGPSAISRGATGAPLSPLGTDTRWAPQPPASGASSSSTGVVHATPGRRSVAAAKHLTALHARLGINGLVPASTPSPPPAEADAGSQLPPVDGSSQLPPVDSGSQLPVTSALTVAAPVPPPTRKLTITSAVAPPRNLSALFGAPGSSSTIGSLLGELDTRREQNPPEKAVASIASPSSNQEPEQREEFPFDIDPVTCVVKARRASNSSTPQANAAMAMAQARLNLQSEPPPPGKGDAKAMLQDLF